MRPACSCGAWAIPTTHQVNIPSNATTWRDVCSTYSIIHERPPYRFWFTVNHQKIGAGRPAGNGSPLLPLLHGPKDDEAQLCNTRSSALTLIPRLFHNLPCMRWQSARSGSSVPRSPRHKAVLCPVVLTFAITGPIERKLSSPTPRLSSY